MCKIFTVHYRCGHERQNYEECDENAKYRTFFEIATPPVSCHYRYTEEIHIRNDSFPTCGETPCKLVLPHSPSPPPPTRLQKAFSLVPSSAELKQSIAETCNPIERAQSPNPPRRVTWTEEERDRFYRCKSDAKTAVLHLSLVDLDEAQGPETEEEAELEEEGRCEGWIWSEARVFWAGDKGEIGPACRCFEGS